MKHRLSHYQVEKHEIGSISNVGIYLLSVVDTVCVVETTESHLLPVIMFQELIVQQSNSELAVPWNVNTIRQKTSSGDAVLMIDCAVSTVTIYYDSQKVYIGLDGNGGCNSCPTRRQLCDADGVILCQYGINGDIYHEGEYEKNVRAVTDEMNKQEVELAPGERWYMLYENKRLQE